MENVGQGVIVWVKHEWRWGDVCEDWGVLGYFGVGGGLLLFSVYYHEDVVRLRGLRCH